MRTPQRKKETERLMNLERITILGGAFGSGKSELALDLAFKGAAVLVDLDIVNPYFKSSTQRAALEQAGVRVISPSFAQTGVDAPAIPPDVQSVFEIPGRVIMDVGGDDVGSRVLGRFRHLLEREPVTFLFVVNVFRPMSATTDDILALMERVTARARMPFTGLVNNANLQDETTIEHILQGARVLSEVAEATGLPVVAHAVDKRLLASLPDALKPLAWPMTPRLRPKW